MAEGAPRYAPLHATDWRGRIIGRSTGNTAGASLNSMATLDAETLTSGCRRLLQELYAPRAYDQRVFRFLGEYRPARPCTRLQFADGRAFLGALWVIGVTKPGRREL
ncbi:MAG: DUF4070 domain-containing protein [Phycisphaerales bacterium]|nr:DUF4070 domain-containing protein [Phycisphaerales bacterium]